MRLSKDEEERRKRAVESSNGALFNDLEEKKCACPCVRYRR